MRAPGSWFDRVNCARLLEAPAHLFTLNTRYGTMTTKVMVFTALLAIAATGALRAQQPAAQQPADAASLYARSCASCHGAKGTPSPAMLHSMPGLPDFASAAIASVPDSVLRNVITNGKPPMMLAYKTRLTADQISALVTYIKAFSRH